MKKILFITLASLIFVACSGRSGRDSDTTSLIVPSCEDSNATLVNGTCECNTGYANDSQGTCVQIQLATPTLRATSTVSGCFVIAFNDVQDLNGEAVPSGKVHFIYKNMIPTTGTNKPSTVDSHYCDKSYTDTISCSVGSIYPPAVNPVGAGTYCIKAISCADGYKDSAVLTKQQAITSGSGIINCNNTNVTD